MHPSSTAHNTLTRLTRLAQRRPRARAWLEKAFDKYLGRLAAPALEVSAETGDPVGPIFARVLRTGGDDDLLGELAEQLDASPYTHAVTLREVGLVVVERNIEMRRRWWPEPTLAQRHDLAQLEITRALRLEEVVGLEEGIASSQQAVGELRLLWEEGFAAAEIDLADAIHNLAVQLGQKGDHAAALAASEEASASYRRLADRGFEGGEEHLAIALDNQGIVLSGAGDDLEALKAFQESRDMLENAPISTPERARPTLNLGLSLWRSGHPTEALRHTREAVESLRQPYAEQPLVFGPDLARGLNNLSLIFGGLSRAPEAFLASQESVEIRRALYEERPAAFRAEFARSLVNFAMDQALVEGIDKALATAREAVALLEVEQSAEDEAIELFRGLNNLGFILSVHGEWEEAAAVFRRGVEILEPLEHAREHPDLAMIYTNLGKALYHLGRWSEAVEALDRGVKLFDDLASSGPLHMVLERSRTSALERLVSPLCQLDDLEAAVRAARRAADGYTRLAREAPERFRTDLAIAQSNLAILLDATGLPEEAAKLSRHAVDRQRSFLAEGQEAGAEADANLAVLLRGLGNLLSEQGHRDEARAAMREAVEIFEQQDAEIPGIAALLEKSILALQAMEKGDARAPR